LRGSLSSASLFSCRENDRIAEPLDYVLNADMDNFLPKCIKCPKIIQIMWCTRCPKMYKVSECIKCPKQIDRSSPWPRFCLLSKIIRGYCHSLKLSDVPRFFFDDLGLKGYCKCLFLHRNSETYDIQLPPRPSVGQGAIAVNANNFGFFAEVVKL
jgi:hypothetical protein